jgi:hypothetical protein
MRKTLLLLATLLLTLARSAHAQAVRGQLVDPVNELGIPGARVLLLDDTGRRVASTLTDAEGGFVLNAPAGGRYTVRAERVGYRPTVSDAVVLSAGEVTRRRLVAAATPVALQAIGVQGNARCEVRPGSGAPAAAVWDEARKALDLAQAALAERRYLYQVTRYQRQLDPRTGTVLAETGRTTGGIIERPFVTVDPALLADSGFVQPQGDTIAYDVPDADVLLSDAFLDAHCFRVQPGRGGDTARVGLAFEPARGRRRSDVRGVIWMDARSAELRSVEYEYTQPPVRGPQGVPGGEIFFRRLPNGSWIVSRWYVRMPVAEDRRTDYALVHEIGPTRIAQIREEGAEVTRITTHDGGRVDTEPAAILTGLVWDSTRAAPLAGARVFLSGTGFAAVTDTSGRYVLRGLREGSYSLGFSAPRLDSLGFDAPLLGVTLDRGATVRRDLALPPLLAVLAAGCAADSARPEQPGVLTGVVRDSRSGVPVPQARVTLGWGAPGAGAGQAQAEADERGVFRFCHAPVGVPLRVTASMLGGSVALPQVQLVAGTPLQRDLTLAVAGRRVAAAAPDASGAAARSSATRRGSTSQHVITRAEIDRAKAGDVRQLIQRLRPQWLLARGGNVGLNYRDTVVAGVFEHRPVSIPLAVFVDGQQQEGITALERIDPGYVELVEFLEAADAATRFGAVSSRGVIVVTTRGKAPRS